MRTLRHSLLAGVLAPPLFLTPSMAHRAEAHRGGFGWGLAAGIATAVIINEAYRHRGYYRGYPAYGYYEGYSPYYGGEYYGYSAYPRSYSTYPAPHYGGGYYRGYGSYHRHHH